MSNFVLCTHSDFISLSIWLFTVGGYFNLSWIWVCIYQHQFNNLAKILNVDLFMKIWQWIHSHGFIDRACNFSTPYKFNCKCVFKGKFGKNVKPMKWNSLFVIQYVYTTHNKHPIKGWMVIYRISNILKKTDKNQTHSLPTTSNTLNLIFQKLTYIFLWHSRY